MQINPAARGTAARKTMVFAGRHAVLALSMQGTAAAQRWRQKARTAAATSEVSDAYSQAPPSKHQWQGEHDLPGPPAISQSSRLDR